MKLVIAKNWSVARLAGGIALAAAGVLATLDAWADLFRTAVRDEEQSHIILVPLVAAYLIWVRKRRLRHIQPVRTWVGPLCVLVGWMLYDLGDTRLWASVWQLGAIMVVVGCLLTAVGAQVLRQFLPAFVVLVLLIPIPGRVRQEIAVPMQTATAKVTQTAFELAGVEVLRSGNLLSYKGQEVAIAEACNGLRMVFALLLVCYAFAFGNPLRPYARLLILAASPLAAIGCNVVRLVPTVYVYGTQSQTTADTFHTLSGWVMLFVAFLLLMGILRLLRWAMLPVYRFTLAYD